MRQTFETTKVDSKISEFHVVLCSWIAHNKGHPVAKYLVHLNPSRAYLYCTQVENWHYAIASTCNTDGPCLINFVVNISAWAQLARARKITPFSPSKALKSWRPDYVRLCDTAPIAIDRCFHHFHYEGLWSSNWEKWDGRHKRLCYLATYCWETSAGQRTLRQFNHWIHEFLLRQKYNRIENCKSHISLNYNHGIGQFHQQSSTKYSQGP